MSAPAEPPAAGPLAAPRPPGETEAVFAYVQAGQPFTEAHRAAASALADGGYAAEYGVDLVESSPGRIVISRHDGAPLPKPGAPAWRRLSRLVREAIGGPPVR